MYEASPVQGEGEIPVDTLRQTAKSLEKRINALGTAEPEIWTEGTDRIRVRIAGVTDEEQVREMLKKPSELTVRGPDNQVELTGTDFVEGAAQVVYDEMRNPNIQVTVKNKEKLESLSKRLLGQTISINLDERVLTAPVIQAVLTNGICRITGQFTYDDAKNIVDTINMGALPLKLTEKFSQSVGASLGQQSLEQTLTAGAAGSILILLFMLALYRLPGIVASITLITYSWLLLLFMNLMQATLTLPGIAAFVLGIGMAVDANIINYERFREELRTGKTPLSAFKAGSKRSFKTIMDANVTTLIAGFVLFSLGSGGD
ncbi:preprotein translocase subunit SecD [Cohnella rhizosphaerae]|uniref:preprotein translocase subunit SecD n=1 Tax=Cohnella rhizosphaerae TaxID=1457232 RepID=UPI0030B89FF5